MEPRTPMIGERAEAAYMCTQAEVDALIQNIMDMNLAEGSPELKIMCGIPLYGLHKLFNGAKN